MTNLENKVALVTGGARDIGKAGSLKLAASGARARGRIGRQHRRQRRPGFFLVGDQA